uniref:Soluble scavenger receptor cysteine-rich domain-containing protein SSC5D n=1 Tax=Chrysemys picta bellii TaxID=8478 RepID=A0A8C3FMM3_CHRPI
MCLSFPTSELLTKVLCGRMSTAPSLSVYSLGVFADSGIPELTQLRQVNSPSRCAGRVEVLHNQQWGTVCDDSWDITAAGFVCRQLGCGTAEEPPSVPFPAPRASQSATLGLKGSQNAGIPELTQLRLVNSLNRCAGRVEVLHNNQWGTVCHDNWDLTEARVVCRQLGCGTALLAPRGARFGRGSDHIWLDDLNCAGTEAALSECNALPWGENDCNHGEDAGVVCSELAQVRLANGSKHCAGRVEVLHNQQWGTVCDDGWDLQDAGVVCRQLGCGTALSAPGGARFGRGSDPQWLDEVNCAGTEAALSDCRARPWGERDCTHGEDAGVVCSGNLHPSCHSGWCIDRAGKLSAQTQLSCLSQRQVTTCGELPEVSVPRIQHPAPYPMPQQPALSPLLHPNFLPEPVFHTPFLAPAPSPALSPAPKLPPS